MAAQNHWDYRIYRESYNGQPEFIASYIAATDLDSVEADLNSADSYLDRYLKPFFSIDPREYAQKYQLRAQALLGGLAANRHCLLHSGHWLPGAPPPARAVRPPDDLGKPTAFEHGVTLWLREEANATDEA